MDDDRIAQLIDAVPGLTRSPARLLLVLLDRRGRTVSQSEACEAMFHLSGDRHGIDGLRTSLKHLRRATNGLPITVSTVMGIGWRADVRDGWQWERRNTP